MNQKTSPTNTIKPKAANTSTKVSNLMTHLARFFFLRPFRGISRPFRGISRTFRTKHVAKKHQKNIKSNIVCITFFSNHMATSTPVTACKLFSTSNGRSQVLVKLLHARFPRAWNTCLCTFKQIVPNFKHIRIMPAISKFKVFKHFTICELCWSCKLHPASG